MPAVDTKSLEAITVEDICALVNDGVSESLVLEFKRDLPGGSNEDKKEFLKDITALANTNGGTLLFGVEENAGVAVDLVPRSGDADAELTRLNQILLSNVEPRLFGVESRAVAIDGGSIFLFRVPRSWAAPHRVNAYGTLKFYGRTPTNVYELSVDELRRKFTLNGDITSRAASFRNKRLQEIQAFEDGIAVAASPGCVVLHIVPISSLEGAGVCDLAKVKENSSKLKPMGEYDSWSALKIDFDGALILGYSNGRSTWGYTRIYRDGVLEASQAGLAKRDGRGRDITWLAVDWIEQAFFDRIAGYLSALRIAGVQPPLVLMLSVLGTKGTQPHLREHSRLSEAPPPITKENLICPSVLLSDFVEGVALHRLVRPVFDALWNSAGRLSAESFDDEGRWVGTR